MPSLIRRSFQTANLPLQHVCRTKPDRRTRQGPTTKSDRHRYRQGTLMRIVLLRENRINVCRDIYGKTMITEFQKEDSQMDDIKHILVVSRSTKHCKKAIDYGISLAKQNGATLYVLHVFDDPFGLQAWSLPVVSLKQIQEEYRKMQDRTRSDLNRLTEAAENEGISIEVSITDGDVDEKILDFVKDKNIDLLIMLAHEEGHFEHLLFGRSIDRIIRKLPCSVMLVKSEPERTK